VEEVAVDDVGEAPLERAECFAAGAASSESSLDVGLSVGMATALGDGDAV
jgi:hypothetical protein